MGAITKIRQISPYFLGFVAVLFVAFMVIQDSSCETIKKSRKSPENVEIATINGDRITLADYERRVRDVVENQRQQNPNQEIDDETIRQQVYDEMVNEILRKQESAKLGVVVTPQQIIDVMVINPPEQLQFFKDSTGRFDKRLYQELVTNPDRMGEMLAAQKVPQQDIDRQLQQWKKTLFDIEDGLRSQMLQQTLASAVGASASIPSVTEAEVQYKNSNSMADVQFIALSTDRVADNAVSVSDDEIKAYYEKNKEYNLQKRSRALKYLVFPQVPSLKDTQNAAKRSQRLAEDLAALPTAAQKDSAFTAEMTTYSGVTTDFVPLNQIDAMTSTVLASLAQGEVFGPLNTAAGITYFRLDGRREGVTPVVRASHILIQFGTNKDSAKAEAMKIMGRAKKGEDFAELARTYSKDPGSAQQGGDLNFFGKGRMVPECETAVFAPGVGVGDVVGPVETQFGFHVIKVTDRQTTELKFSQIVLKPTISSATKQQTMARAQKAADDIIGGAPIDSVGKALKMPVQVAPLFTSDSPVLSSRELTSWAFENDKGAVIRKDVKYYGTVVSQVSDAREVGIKPYEDMKDKIKSILLQRKKLDYLKAKAEQIAASPFGSDSSVAVMSQSGLRNNGAITGFGGEFLATEKAFSTAPGSTTGAVRGNRAWFVIKVNARTDANMSLFPSERNAVMQNMSTKIRNQAYYAWFQKVKDNSEIEDLRNKRND
ncbi:MAG: peptidylprolyl isomerase [Candidatus Kapabacteria bacterium]|nr:peptidylprolyl isomerase [Candidatus Kapabacteria bacterium]